ncbi:MAG TPA: response regulator, partial [Lachnospiraceae bacterium]|nr:response regulator [Lachnospiraceae bacterium]
DRYDLILMDYMMPVIDGRMATQIIRKLNGCSVEELPIIALTADVLRGTKDMLLSSGMNDYLAKPIEIEKLDEILRKYIPEEKKYYKQDTGRAEDAPRLFQKEDAIDEEAAMRQCMNDFGMYRLVVQTFAEESAEMQEKLEDAYAKESAEDYTIYAHALKSAAASVGAMDVREIAYRMEMYGKKGHWSEITRDHEEFMKMIRELRELIGKRL